MAQPTNLRADAPHVPRAPDPDEGGAPHAIDKAREQGGSDPHPSPAEIASLRGRLQEGFGISDILSVSPRMHEIFELVRKVANTNTTVLIEGETGTGKEQLARAIHTASTRRDGPWVAINCSAVPETLLESELFGHEKGSFTNAMSQRIGRFEQAHGGTLFLDEIGDVPLPMQAKLLRVLQERCFERVGGADSIDVDVRIIAATNRSLRRMVRRGKFREDLYYRLNVLPIEMPALRERSEDVPLLAAHFAMKHAPEGQPPKRFSPAAMDRMIQHAWPGNVRELENVVQSVSIRSPDPVIDAQDLTLLPSDVTASFSHIAIDLSRPLRDLLQDLTTYVEKQYLLKALQKTGGHVGKVAKMSGYCRRTVTAKLSEYRIKRSALADSRP
jgi:two-component system response regulator AtoC